MTSRPWVMLTSLLLAAAACTRATTAQESSLAVLGSSTSTETTDQGTAVTSEGQPDAEVEVGCDRAPAEGVGAIPADPVLASRRLSADVFPCADTVVLVGADHEPAALIAAAEQAAELSAPLLLTKPTLRFVVADEIARLDPQEVIWFGPEDEADHLESLVDAPIRVVDSPPSTATAEASLIDAASELALTNEPPAVAVLPAGDPATAVVLAPALAASNTGSLLLAPDSQSDLDALPSDVPIVVSQAFTPTQRWRIEATAAGAELPGGGLDLFPDRRIVAFYGSPVTFRLGLLGERSPERTVERLQPVLESYRLDDTPVYGGFELIATVADRKPGDDGDYSNELTPDELRPWIEIATENDLFVVIDLQPGRTDFLTQAKRYEEFLRLPNVGLALDPEWRIGPNERHLVRIGHVDADEVNTVVEWLAGIVREERLPQKMLVLHQFLERMLPDRHRIDTPPEVAVVIHVDGQGGLGSKYDTYDEMVQAPTAPEQTLWWGWKNFLDEDRPVATPAQALSVTPIPVVVTFQ